MKDSHHHEATVLNNPCISMLHWHSLSAHFQVYSVKNPFEQDAQERPKKPPKKQIRKWELHKQMQKWCRKSGQKSKKSKQKPECLLAFCFLFFFFFAFFNVLVHPFRSKQPFTGAFLVPSSVFPFFSNVTWFRIKLIGDHNTSLWKAPYVTSSIKVSVITDIVVLAIVLLWCNKERR